MIKIHTLILCTYLPIYLVRDPLSPSRRGTSCAGRRVPAPAAGGARLDATRCPKSRSPTSEQPAKRAHQLGALIFIESYSMRGYASRTPLLAGRDMLCSRVGCSPGGVRRDALRGIGSSNDRSRVDGCCCRAICGMGVMSRIASGGREGEEKVLDCAADERRERRASRSRVPWSGGTAVPTYLGRQV